MFKIQHQLKNEPYYFPTWEVKYLFLGTFNPEGGEEVKYYYGRPKNNFWSVLSEIFNVDFSPNSSDFFDLLKEYEIGCIDIIDSINVDKNQLDDILGKGYKDSKIINNKVQRTYNTANIIKFLGKNEHIKVYSTWGVGSSLKEWSSEVNKIKDITPLVSPSQAARVPKGTKKYDYILSDWKNKIVL